MNDTMNNDELLDQLRTRLASGELSADAVRELLPDSVELDLGNQQAEPQAKESGMPSSMVTRLLYIVGAIFIILGVLYLVSQIWDDLSTFNRIFITLGLGLTFAGCGSYFMISAPQRELGTVFHAIGGFMVPGGALVALVELSDDPITTWPVTLTIGVVFAFYVLLVIYHRKVVLNFFAFINGSALAYLLMDSMVPTADGDLYAYLTMAIGASYLIYAYAFENGWNDRLIPPLYFFGALGFYIAAFSRIFDSLLMEMLFPFFAFGGLVMAVSVFKSRIVLILSTLAIISYIIYFTAEYFADSIGWPVALILLGFIVIGIGYLSVGLSRKYLRSQ